MELDKLDFVSAYITAKSTRRGVILVAFVCSEGTSQHLPASDPGTNSDEELITKWGILLVHPFKGG